MYPSRTTLNEAKPGRRGGDAHLKTLLESIFAATKVSPNKQEISLSATNPVPYTLTTVFPMVLGPNVGQIDETVMRS
jgi:hypothetical protein